ncbi:28S ribosomal protein S5, mitochondrial [Umbelopsis sp. WA50703]
MLSISRAFSKLSVASCNKSVSTAVQRHVVPCTLIRSYATTSDKKPRHYQLNENNVADLSKVDPLLDFSEDKPTTLDQPKTFPFNRPAEVVLNTVTDNIDTPLDRLEQSRLLKKALVVKRVVNMNGKGKQPSMYALVVVGNGNGLAGYGEGKDEEASRAVRKATNRAIKNMRYFERYDERTIAMDVSHKFHATTIHLRSRPPGFGNRSNHYIHEICRCVGIHDLSGKVMGSRTPMNVIKATFEALQHQKFPEEIAQLRGKKLADVQHTYYGAQ